MLASATVSLDPILLELALLFALCVAVVLVFHRLRVPPIVGFLLTGVVIGPNALRLVRHQELVEQLSEVGVVILLFSVGLELPLRQLAELRRRVLVGGSLQIGLTLALGTAAAMVGGLGWQSGILLGLLLAMSSTAVATKVLADRGELGSPVARFALAILIAQDLAVVPVILLLPLLAGSGQSAGELAQRTVFAFLWLALAVAAARLIVPRVLDLVCRTRSREAFILALIGMCLAMAVATGQLGLSLALGAFLAGVVVADSDFHHMAMSEVEPFRDALSSLFFVSIGMLFDPAVLVQRPLTVLVALLAVVAGKSLVVLAVARWMAKPAWLGLRSGLLLALVGEFSFVLVQIADPRLLPGQWREVFLAVAVLSIAATPVSYALGCRRRTPPEAGAAEGAGERGRRGRTDHAVIVGFGPAGQAVGRALRALKIPLTVIEMNAATVKAHKENGIDILIGDSTRQTVLRAAGIRTARVLVLAINDADATRNTAALARTLSPHVKIMARANYLGEVGPLLHAGASEVVVQEMETAVELMARTLRSFLVPDDEIERRVQLVRSSVPGSRRVAGERLLDPLAVGAVVPGIGLRIALVQPGCAAAGRSLADVQLRQRTGVTVIALKRGAAITTEIEPSLVLREGDVVVLVGPDGNLAEALDLMHAANAARG